MLFKVPERELHVCIYIYIYIDHKCMYTYRHPYELKQAVYGYPQKSTNLAFTACESLESKGSFD